MGLSVRATPRRRGEACSSQTQGESRSFPSGKKTPTGRPYLWAGEDGRAEGERGWAGTRNGPGQRGPSGGRRKEKRKKEGEWSWAGPKNRVRKEKVLHFLKTTQTLQFKFEFKNSNSNRTTSNKTMHCSMNATQQKKQPYLI